MTTPLAASNGTTETLTTWHRQLVAVLFVGMLWAPCVLFALRVARPDAQRENRMLAASPSLYLSTRTLTSRTGLARTGESLATFPKRAEDFVVDHFPGRAQLAGLHNQAIVDGLGSSPSPAIVLGTNRWLYLDAEWSMDQFRRVRPLTSDHCNGWAEFLHGLHDWLAARGIPLVIVICPNKETIYPEHMPADYNRLDNPHPTDQVLAAATARPGLDLLDLRAAMLRAKQDAQVYYRLDSHWNDRGILAAYQELMHRLTRYHAGITAHVPSDFDFEDDPAPPTDLSNMLRIVWPDRDVRLVRRYPRPNVRSAALADAGAAVNEIDRAELPRAAVLYDSFFVRMHGLLTEHFSRSHWYIWKRDPRPTMFEQVQPHVVIYERVERDLMLPAPTLSFLHAADFEASGRSLVQLPATNGNVEAYSIPAPTVEPGGRLVVRLAVNVPTDGVVTLHFRRTVAGELIEGQCSRTVKSGRNDVCALLPEDVVGTIDATFAGWFIRSFGVENAEVRQYRAPTATLSARMQGER